MISHIYFHQSCLGIRIAVLAQVTAGIVSSYVHSKKAGTCSVSLIALLFRNFQMAVKCYFKRLNRHTTRTVCSICRQFCSFCTWPDCHSIVSRNFDQCFSKLHSIFLCNRLCLWKIPFYFLIKIEKTDHTRSGITAKCMRHFIKFCDMPFHGMFFIQKNGIISPAYTFHTYDARQALKTFDYVLLIGNIWLDVFSIRRNRHKPVLPIRF